MDVLSVKRAITPLRLVFWGGLLCIFDLNIISRSGDTGFKFDILNDAVGTLLIAVGVFRLGAIAVNARYGSLMTFVKVVSVLAVLNAIRAHVITPLSPVISLALLIFSFVSLTAIVAFCVAMRWFCDEAGLAGASQSWKATTVLFVAIYLIPVGLFDIVCVLALAGCRSFNVDLGPAAILLLAVFAIPVIHLFVSTSRMKRGAEAAPSIQPSDGPPGSM